MAMDISGVIRTGPDTSGQPAREGGTQQLINRLTVTKPEPEIKEAHIDTEALLKAIEDIKLVSAQVQKRLKFRVDESIDRVIVTVIDRKTGDVLKEIPSREIQKLHDHVRDAMGLLFDREI